MFLDEVADRYFCLPNAANDAFLRLAAGSPQQGDGQRVRLLVDRGLLIEAGPGATIVTPASIVAPGRDLVDERQSRCLVRALAVHRACRKGRVAGSRLVFGVTAHPFAAHCWVQLGNAVLVGGYEQARLFTPILVLG